MNWNKIKSYVTNVWAIVSFITVGGGYAVYDRVILEPKRVVVEQKAEINGWVREYGRTSKATAKVVDGKIHVDWEIMKVPPTFSHYDLKLFLMTSNLSKINELGHIHVYNGDWGREQRADDWTDFRTIRYRGTPFNVPDDLPPGEYALSYNYILHTKYGTFTTTLNPIYFQIE